MFKYSGKHCGQRRNWSTWAISPSSTMFSKVVCCYCRLEIVKYVFSLLEHINFYQFKSEITNSISKFILWNIHLPIHPRNMATTEKVLFHSYAYNENFIVWGKSLSCCTFSIFSPEGALTYIMSRLILYNKYKNENTIITLSLVRQFCSRWLWTYFVKT